MAKKQEHTWTEVPEFVNATGGPHFRPMRLYLLAKLKYYKGTPIMSDAVFDAFEDKIKLHFPDCPALKIVGEPQQEDAKELTEWMHRRSKEYKEMSNG